MHIPYEYICIYHVCIYLCKLHVNFLPPPLSLFLLSLALAKYKAIHLYLILHLTICIEFLRHGTTNSGPPLTWLLLVLLVFLSSSMRSVDLAGGRTISVPSVVSANILVCATFSITLPALISLTLGFFFLARSFSAWEGERENKWGRKKKWNGYANGSMSLFILISFFYVGGGKMHNIILDMYNGVISLISGRVYDVIFPKC